MADAIADALSSLKDARQQQALTVAQEQTRLNALDQMIERLESSVVVIDPELMPHRKDYEGLGITEAAKRFLAEVGQELTTPELAKGLLERGLTTRSKRFVPTIYSTLTNNMNSGHPLFVRKGEGREAVWALREARKGGAK